MKLQNVRRKAANTVQNSYDLAYNVGDAALAAAETFESHLRLISKYRQDNPHKAAHLIARLTRIAVHTALFTVWAPATFARFALLTTITGQKPDPQFDDQQSTCPSL